VPCLIGLLALVFPRVALFLVWLSGGHYLDRAYQHWVWPLLGFFFLPLTTLVYAFAHNSMNPPGHVSPLGWVLVGIAVIIDLGLLHRGRHHAYRWRDERR
jgi:hypothetical protein